MNKMKYIIHRLFDTKHKWVVQVVCIRNNTKLEVTNRCSLCGKSFGGISTVVVENTEGYRCGDIVRAEGDF